MHGVLVREQGSPGDSLHSLFSAQLRQWERMKQEKMAKIWCGVSSEQDVTVP